MYNLNKAARWILLGGLFTMSVFPCLAQEADSTATTVEAQADSAASVVVDRAKGPKVSIFVVDAANGRPLSGASVSIPGYSAAITDEKGKARVTIPSANALVEVSTAGFLNREEYLRNRDSIVVRMQQPGFQSLFGKLNMPTGSYNKSSTPFSVSSVSQSENWNENSRETADTYLQGKINGLNVIRRSGTPSAGAELFVRGGNSLHTSRQPLVVVDGMIYNNDDLPSLFSGFSSNALENIDLKDIEEVILIKDAGAALYGTKGANGVLFISTRRARSETTKIDFGAFGGFNESVKSLPVLSASDYRVYLSSLYSSTSLSGSQIAALPFFKTSAGNDPNFFKYQFDTDWQKEVLSSSYNQNYHLNVSGGDNIARYNLSLGYVDNSGIINNSGMTRYFTRFNSDFAFSKKLRAATNLSFSSSQHTLFNQGAAYRTAPLYLSLVKSPFTSPNDVGLQGEISPNFAQADVFGLSNPAAIVGGMDAINNSYRVSTAATITYQLNSRLGIETQLGVLYDKSRDRLFIPARGLAKDTLTTALANNELGSNTNRLFALFNDSRVSYSATFAKVHKFDARAGIRFKQDTYETDRGLTYNSSTDEYRSLSGGNSNLRDIDGSLRNMRWLNTYFSTNYFYNNKYLLSLNAAIDGSSRFGRSIPDVLTINGNKFAVMPSVGAAWLASSEKFLAGNSKVDLLKLRVSYGLVGNDDIGDYAARAYYVSQSFYDLEGFTRGNVGNTGLKWESVEKLNGGLDLGLFGESLNVSFDVYRNYTRDMLTFDQLSPVTGYVSTPSNGGEMKTTGFDLSIGAKILNKKLKWDANVMISSFRSKITKLASGSFYTDFGGATILTAVGSSPNVFYGYRTNGVYTTAAEAGASNTLVNPGGTLMIPVTAGDVRFVNRYNSPDDISNNRIVIDQNDRAVIGDPTPDFTGMLGNTLSYKNWSLNALFTFSSGNDVYNATRHQLESMSGFQNQLQSVNNRWRADGQETSIPKAVLGDPVQNSRFSDRWIEDGSYLRLRTLSISYNFPVKNNAYLKTLKVYGNANNLFTLTNYLGYDPEFSGTRSVLGQGVDMGLEPQFRSVQFGVRVGI